MSANSLPEGLAEVAELMLALGVAGAGGAVLSSVHSMKVDEPGWDEVQLALARAEEKITQIGVKSSARAASEVGVRMMPVVSFHAAHCARPTMGAASEASE